MRSLLLAAALTAPVLAQAADVAPIERLDAIEHAERQRVRALLGIRGMPEPPPLLADSPLDDLSFADRVTDEMIAAAAGGPEGTGFVEVTLTGAETGTGLDELFQYQLPSTYDGGGTPHAMVVAYHGYSMSANSVQLTSELDEECEARGWVFMAPTGVDQQVFGTVDGQTNISAAIQHMLDNFNVDADRIYLVGFSMGGGISASYASRHRDPDGIMIAALGIVSSTFDWTLSYNENPSLTDVLENPLNFGGPPTTFPFAYQQVSALYFEGYPPVPGQLNAMIAMASNLATTPTYVTWDISDTLPLVLAQTPVFASYVNSLGGDFQQRITTGTIPPHSWGVVDPVHMFDFFDGKSVDRTPQDVEGQTDRNASMSYLGVVQDSAGAFSYADGDTSGGDLTVESVVNADSVTVDGGEAGLPAEGGPLHVTAESDDAGGYDLALTGFAERPAYLLDFGSGAIITGTDSDPLTDTLFAPVPGNGTLDANLVFQPWLGDLTTSPEPAPIGSVITLDVDAPSTSATAWLIVGFEEALANIKGGNKIIVSTLPPALVLPLPLDGNGDVSVPGGIPNDPLLSGVEVLMQFVATLPNGKVDTVSNMWRMEVE